MGVSGPHGFPLNYPPVLLLASLASRTWGKKGEVERRNGACAWLTAKPHYPALEGEVADSTVGTRRSITLDYGRLRHSSVHQPRPNQSSAFGYQLSWVDVNKETPADIVWTTLAPLHPPCACSVDLTIPSSLSSAD
ncbi:unnamed protein product [Diplocarpon coronariae]